jgi:hypothetical protein
VSSSPRIDLSTRLRPVSQLALRSVDWLWPGRLPLGKLVIFEGDPGLGKSVIALDLCARLSTARPLPDNSQGPGIVSSVVLSNEDNAEDTIHPRLRHFGADRDRVFVLDAEGLDDGDPVRFPSEAGTLEEAVARTAARLVVIDPITAFLDPSVNVNSEASVRRALAPLKRLAEKYGCTVLLIRHLNKRGGSRAVYRGANSIAFVAVCRSGWLFAPDPREPAHSVMAQVKNNLGPPQPSLAYAVARQEGALPTLTWLGPCDLTADQLLARAAHPRRLPTPRERACDFLAGVLEGGPRTSREIWELAQGQGLSERTLQRARQELGARPVRVWVEGKLLSYWLLPGQQLPSSALPPEAAPPDLEPWLAPLREQFPPLTPLDDL